jgi:ribosomal protein L11 methyltransferase
MKSNNSSILHLALVTSAEAEDAAVELLSEMTGIPAVSYRDAETGEITVSVYLEKFPSNLRQQAGKCVVQIRKAGLDPSPAKIRLRRLPRENWAESWKRHFKPIRVGGALLIKPSWSRLKSKKREQVVVLDPGLSFGTGHHATTSFCLETLVQIRPLGKSASFLDVGTGAGILAICAVKLGYQPVEAWDFDPESIRVSRENADLNAVSFTLRKRDILKNKPPAKRFDLVCANLTADILEKEARQISNYVRDEGHLVLAGILDRQFNAIRTVFGQLGWNLEQSNVEKEWKSGMFRRR